MARKHVTVAFVATKWMVPILPALIENAFCDKTKSIVGGVNT